MKYDVTIPVRVIYKAHTTVKATSWDDAFDKIAKDYGDLVCDVGEQHPIKGLKEGINGLLDVVCGTAKKPVEIGVDVHWEDECAEDGYIDGDPDKTTPEREAAGLFDTVSQIDLNATVSVYEVRAAKDSEEDEVAQAALEYLDKRGFWAAFESHLTRPDPSKTFSAGPFKEVCVSAPADWVGVNEELDVEVEEC